MERPIPAILILSNQKKYYGWSFNKNMRATGELVFNTGMTGYQEIITDPSYRGQLVTFTYPEIGNTGTNKQDNESLKPQIAGMIMRHLCRVASSWRNENSLINYLTKNDIPHIYGIDTRSLTNYLRLSGTMKVWLFSRQNYIQGDNIEQIAKETYEYINGQNETKLKYKWSGKYPYQSSYTYLMKLTGKHTSYNLRILVLDFGTKRSILYNLGKYTNCILVLPGSSNLDQILSYKPHGIVLSNGPGDPQTWTNAITTVQQLLDYRIPILGICMGHQILSLALDMTTFKLKFGHRGLNHPVGLFKQVYITSQNHGFAVGNEEISQKIYINQFNYNDQTLAALSHRTYPYFSTQYHPEANPGPHDTSFLFLHFIRVIKMMLY